VYTFYNISMDICNYHVHWRENAGPSGEGKWRPRVRLELTALTLAGGMFFYGWCLTIRAFALFTTGKTNAEAFGDNVRARGRERP